MGIVEGFEYDVFVSYAHIDNLPYGLRQTGWVDEFAHDLQNRLSMVAGSHAAVWRDPRLRGHQVLWPAIQEALAASAILLAVISPRYITSTSCQQEWSRFESTTTKPQGSAVRLLHAIKLPVERPKLPRPFQDQLGYEFFAIDGGDGDPTELDRSTPLYFSRINSLARDIHDLLDRMNSAWSTVK